MAVAILSKSSAFQRRTNTDEQTLIIERFSQEIDRASSECLRSHSRISVRRDKDDWYLAAIRYQFSLQFQTVHAGHTNITDQAGNLVLQA
jgi:hypothetical protein